MIDKNFQLTFDLFGEESFNRDDFIISNSNKDALAWIDSWPTWPVNVSGLNVFGSRAIARPRKEYRHEKSLASTPEVGPQNLSPGRKFHVESDFRVKNKEFRTPGAKN